MANFVVQAILKLRDDLSRPLTGAFSHIENLGDRVTKRLGKRLRSAFSLKKVGVLAGLGAAGLGVAAHRLNDVADSMARVNAAAKAQDLAPDFLSALMGAAAEQGVENTDDVIRATEEFFLRLTELQQKDPTGELYSNLKDIGATQLIKQFKNTSDATEALKLALSALATESDQAKKIRLADSLFGGSDAGLDLRRIANTREELKRLFDRQSELSGATKEQFEAAGRLGAAKAKLLTQFRAITMQLAGKLIPAFETAIGRVSRWVSANQDLVDSKLGEFAAWVTEKITKLIEVPWAEWLAKAASIADDVKDGLVALTAAAAAVGRVFLGAGRNVVSMAQRLGLGTRHLIALAQAFFAAWAWTKLARLGQGLRAMGKNVAGLVTSLRNAASGASAAGRTLRIAFAAAGPIALVATLASTVMELVGSLEAAKEAAKPEVKADFFQQATRSADEVASLRQQIKDLEAEMQAFNLGARNTPAVAEALQAARASLAQEDIPWWHQQKRESELVREALRTRIEDVRALQAQAERRMRTSEFLGRLAAGEEAPELATPRIGFQQLLSGETETPEVQALRDAVARIGDTAELDRLIGLAREQENARERASQIEAARAERTTDQVSSQAIAPRGQQAPAAPPPTAQPAPVPAELAAAAKDLRGAVVSLAGLLAGERTRADLGRR